MVEKMGNFTKICHLIKLFILLIVFSAMPTIMVKLQTNVYVCSLIMMMYIFFGYMFIKHLYIKYSITFNNNNLRLNTRDIIIDISLLIIKIAIIQIGYRFILPIFQNNSVSDSVEFEKYLFVVLKQPWPCALSYVLNIIIFGPILEEFIFRGFFFRYFFNKQNYIIGGFITTLVFCLLHSNNSLIELSIHFTSALFIFIAFYRNLNIKDSILVHMLNNLLYILMIMYYLIQH